MPDVAVLHTDASVVRSLLEGEGIIDLRPAGEAPPPGSRLWLQADGPPVELKPAYRSLSNLAPPPDPAMITGWAEVAGAGTVRVDDQAIEALGGKTVVAVQSLADADVAVVALRAYRLAQPARAGDLPADPAAAESQPALSDGAFEAKLEALADSVPGFSR